MVCNLQLLTWGRWEILSLYETKFTYRDSAPKNISFGDTYLFKFDIKIYFDRCENLKYSIQFCSQICEMKDNKKK